MAVAADEAALRAAFETARSAAARADLRRPGGPAGAVLSRGPGTSRCRSSALADGRVVALGERDCSVQRRHQKVAEETPVAGRRRPSCARGCSPPPCGPAEAVGYRGAGTVECLLDADARRVRLPGDEHPAAGRAPGHRDGHRHRPGRAAAAHRRRATPVDLRPGRRCPRRARARAAGERRGPGAVPARARGRSPPGRSRPVPGSGSTPATRRATRSRPHYDSLMAKLVRARSRPGRGARPGPGGGGGLPGRGTQVQPAVLRRAAGDAGVRLRATTTPASSGGCAPDAPVIGC